MASPFTVYVRPDLYEWCETKVFEGRFRSFSDVVDYAMGFYFDSINRDRIKGVTKIPRGEAIKKSVRVNQYVMDGLMATGFFDRAEIVDYALDHYRRWLDNDGREVFWNTGFIHHLKIARCS